MNRQLLLALVSAVLVSACSSPGGNAPVELSERPGLAVDGGGAYQLVSVPFGVQVPTQAYEPEVAIIGSVRGGGSVVRFRRSTRPAGNGGQLQQMTFERTDFGPVSGGVEVPFLPTTFCEPTKECPTAYYASVVGPMVLEDRSVVMAGLFGSVNPSVVFDPPQRLLRFSLDGGLLLNTPIAMEKPAQQAMVTGLTDGTLVVSYSRGAGYSSDGVAIELRAEDSGAITSTVTLDSTDVADSGVGLPARAIPAVTKLVPLRGGGFLAVGQVEMTRSIACGSQDAPEPGGCGQGTAHAMLVKFDQDGKQLWRRDLGRDFEQPGSYFVDATELQDGSLVATGHVEKRTRTWLEPDHGALVTRLSANGAILTATRFCPCTSFGAGGVYALASNPRALENGEYEVMFRDGKGVATATRFNAANELVGAGRLQGTNILQLFITTESGWASFDAAKTQLIHHELAPR